MSQRKVTYPNIEDISRYVLVQNKVLEADCFLQQVIAWDLPCWVYLLDVYFTEDM